MTDPTDSTDIDGDALKKSLGACARAVAGDESLQVSFDKGQSALEICLLYTSPSPRDQRGSRMPSSA